MSSIVLFGGSGFVGRHLQKMIFEQKLFATIYVADIRAPREKNDRCVYIPCDVRKPIDKFLFAETPSCIVNLAAVHTSPGHPANEYFETNILGAQNICAYADNAGISTLVFTSSISVYGPGEDEKTEESIQMPAIPYGSSKAIAEYIHREWYNKDRNARSLSIVRPGVIFGPGEGGNFTRIANALEKGFFPLPGRTDTIKACLYVKDICRFILSKVQGKTGYCLYNFCLPQKITIGEVVEAFKKVLGYRAMTPVIPLSFITAGVGILGMLNIPIVRKMGMVPERIVKLVRSTNISSKKLIESGFSFQFNLEEALRDWSKDCGGKSLY
jgi:nucleoside-diphosphate-sugar epimerase